MAITRPCLDTDDPAAVALYLQALAFDAEQQLNVMRAGLIDTGSRGGQIIRITANDVTFATATVASQIFLEAPSTFDLFEVPDDATGLWAFGFTVRCDPTGAKTLNSWRHCDARAGYTDTFGDFVQLANAVDTEYESNSATLTGLNASGTFVIPEGLEVGFPDVRLYFTHSNAASTMEILTLSNLWCFKIASHDQLVINA